MATIRKRGNRFHVQIRKRGFPSITKTFSDRKTAETFIKGTESKMERGVFLDSSLADETTISELLERYKREILPAKKGANQELSRITILNRELGQHKLGRLQPFMISEQQRGMPQAPDRSVDLKHTELQVVSQQLVCPARHLGRLQQAELKHYIDVLRLQRHRRVPG